ncbi:LysR family transcriptional regulator [Arthrobacter sp. 35W]|uniref:LysR family transcriptional regulator n=1 Tax=Arthrobacter sp. 35W TaxID=1132441 RepID=UPI000419FA02|nr:LysR family transcriptional regulator [Arthrobacter sp. 35W]
MKITLRQIEIFLAVVAEMHFARAAESIHISQPTVSQEIRRLERGLAVKLFDRTTRAAHLTPAGESLLADARNLVAAANALTEKALLFAPQHVKKLRVVASPSVVNRLLPDVMSQCERQLPELSIEDIPVDTGNVSARLAAEGGDIGLGRFLSAPPGFEQEVLAREPVVVTLSSSHPLAGRESIDLQDLGDLPLLLWPREQNPEYYDALLQICTDRGLSPLILVSPPLIVGARSYLIAEGRAFSLVPNSAASHLSTNLRAVPLASPATLPLEMLWRRHDPRVIVPEFLDIVRAKARALDARSLG